MPSLRLAFFVGENLDGRDVAAFQRSAAGCRVVALYGATETQRAVSYHLFEPADARRRSVPLGRGIVDVQLLVVTPERRLAGVGELGEVWLRSPHLALGYLDDPPLTGQRFARNPFRNDRADRIYRTGDLGRYLPGGGAEFAGREDHQVKVRGVRVEPDEVRHALLDHPGVRDALVVATSDRGHGSRLVAYVVPASGGLELADVRSHVRARLPEAMVPSSFHAIPEIPLTPNGKVDAMRLSAVTSPQSPDRPRDELERLVAALCREILGLTEVPLDTGFFDLGATSLELTSLHLRLQQEIRHSFPIVELFRNPDVRSLARRLAVIDR